MVTAFLALLLRDVRLAWQAGGAAVLTLGFFVMAVSLYPFGLGPAPDRLAPLAAGLVWVTGLFACLLSLDRMFQADFEDGTLVQLFLGRLTPTLLVIAKIMAHWVAVMLPLIVAAPLLALLLQLPPTLALMLTVSLAVGTPALSALGAIAAALTVIVRRGGVVITLLLLPLFVPTLIFGAAVVEAARSGVDPLPALALLAAVSLTALALAPFAAASALRLALE